MNPKPMIHLAAAALLGCGVPLFAQEGETPDQIPGTAFGIRGGMPPSGAWMQPSGEERLHVDGPQARLGHAGYGGEMRHTPPPVPTQEQLRKAGATEQQIQKLEELQFDLRTKQIDLRAVSEKADLALERLMKTSTPDEKVILHAIDARNLAAGELFKSITLQQLQVRQILGEDLMRKLREPVVLPEGTGARKEFGPGAGRFRQNAEGATTRLPTPTRSRE